MNAELRATLKRWGHYQNNRYVMPVNDDAAARDDHPIARARHFAPGTKARAERKLVGRDGYDRRLRMGQAAGLVDVRGRSLPVPMSMVDPVPCIESRSAGGGSGGGAAVAHGSPDELRWIDRALSQLHRRYPMRALVLREEFCGRGGQRAKAASVAQQYGGELTFWQYRRELERALVYLEDQQP